MDMGILFAVLAALSFGVWTVFHQQASGNINNIFGAIVVSFTAVIVGIIFLVPHLKNVSLVSNYKGILFRNCSIRHRLFCTKKL
ncbi:MAG TPA: hypothetical protein VJB87_01100 [Candidatus Nanoarchaeia archaeon]|nr:hypothetical protein [Candidatus Nanoarchaeia archaeon]